MAFWTPVILRRLLELDSYGHGGVDPLRVFSLFLKMVSNIISAKQSLVFCGLIHLESFPYSWGSGNVTAIPKDASFTDSENFRPISITPILSKVCE